MAEKSRDPFWRRNNPIMWGVLATTAVIVFGVWAANQSVCQTDFWGNQSCGGNKWSAFLGAAPNEVGDTLAGFAGALAFVWLIATVWLQGQELAAQREELKEQREATQEMARAQIEHVNLLQIQGEIFLDEQKQRHERRSGELLNQKFEGLRIFFLRPNTFHVSTAILYETGGKSPIEHKIARNWKTDTELLWILEDFQAQLAHVLDALDKAEANGNSFGPVFFRVAPFAELDAKLEDILDLLPSLSEADRQRVINHGVKVLHRQVLKLFDLSEREAA